MEGKAQPDSIVVGVDGSAVGNLALDWAAAQASARGLPIHLVHAFTPDLPSFEFGAGLSVQAIRESGKRLLVMARDRVHRVNPDLPVTGVCTSGYAAAALIRASRHAEYVVVGAHGNGAFSTTALGSVAMQVTTHAYCPAVVVKHSDASHQPYGRVVVGVDGSTHSLQALASAFRQAAIRSAELLVVHAWEARGHEDPTLGSSDWPDYERAQHSRVERALGHEQRHYPEVKVAQQVRRGRAVPILVEAARSADLAVVGSRGLGGFPGLRIGSVCHGVLNRAACPVMVTRSRDDD
ncbi:MAG TPA: universal stress protein [Dermatophilaceae bacterium]|nr:universal stress protein [Dermatophilaceae bacterium]